VDHLPLLIDAVSEYAIFMLTPDGTVATWNAGAHRIKGYTADEVVGRSFALFYTAEDRASGKPERELAQACQDGVCRDDGWRIRKDGSQFWANVVITAIRDADGRLEGFAKVTRDDTDRRKVEQALRLFELGIERERIARELHETVIHQIFGAGLALASAQQYIHDPGALTRIRAAVDVLDEAINEIRRVALGLRLADVDPSTSPERHT
jgi:PAS domain S-box-containing protein